MALTAMRMLSREPRLRLPAERFDPVDGELHLRYVSHPPALTTGKCKLCMGKVHLFGDNLRDALYIDPVFRTDIERIDRAIGVPDRKEHRCYAFVHLEIGFGLFPVAEDLQFGRIFLEFPDKIGDYTMATSGNR